MRKKKQSMEQNYQNQNIIKTLGEKENYKYFGILE